MNEHYAYCKDATCTGCLPSDDDLMTWPIIALWGEMLARCIAQTPATKTREGALAALIEDGPSYRAASMAAVSQSCDPHDLEARGNRYFCKVCGIDATALGQRVAEEVSKAGAE